LAAQKAMRRLLRVSAGVVVVFAPVMRAHSNGKFSFNFSVKSVLMVFYYFFFQ